MNQTDGDWKQMATLMLRMGVESLQVVNAAAR